MVETATGILKNLPSINLLSTNKNIVMLHFQLATTALTQQSNVLARKLQMSQLMHDTDVLLS
jgi:hypothetical protein